MKSHSDSHSESIIQLSGRSESAVEPSSIEFFQSSPLIPVESLNSIDDFADLEELSYQIPTQRFQHIVSSTTPKCTRNQ